MEHQRIEDFILKDFMTDDYLEKFGLNKYPKKDIS